MSSKVHAIEPMFISDEVSGGGIAGDLLPLPDHDEPYEAEPPAETPPDVSFDDSDADDEADKSPVTGLGAVASIACEAAASLPQEGVQSMFQGSFDQGGQVGCHGAAAASEKRAPKHGRGKHSRIGKDVLFEFACAKDSNLGKVGQENGLRVIRLCKEDINLEDPHSIEQFISQLRRCSIHGSIECRPWSQWQHLNRTKYPRLAARISKEQTESAALVEQFIRVAKFAPTTEEIAASNGRVIALAGHYHRSSHGFWRGTCIPRLSVGAPSEFKPTASQQRSHGDSSHLHCA